MIPIPDAARKSTTSSPDQPTGIPAYPPELLYLADVAKALAHPGRLQILRILADRGSCICGDLVDGLPLAQATVSQHLRELKRVGLIKGEIQGPRSCYCLDREAIDRTYAALGRLFAGIGCCPPGNQDSKEIENARQRDEEDRQG